MPLYSRSLIIFGICSLILFLVFPPLFIEFWEQSQFYNIVSVGIFFFIVLFLVVYRTIYRAEALWKARIRYRENIDFLDVLPNALFIWQLSLWMFVIELLLSGVFISYMSGDAFLLMYPLWMIGAGIVFSVAGFLSQPQLKKAGVRLLGVGAANLVLLIVYLQVHLTDVRTAHYFQMVVTSLVLGVYPIWLGMRHAQR